MFLCYVCTCPFENIFIYDRRRFSDSEKYIFFIIATLSDIVGLFRVYCIFYMPLNIIDLLIELLNKSTVWLVSADSLVSTIENLSAKATVQ